MQMPANWDSARDSMWSLRVLAEGRCTPACSCGRICNQRLAGLKESAGVQGYTSSLLPDESARNSGLGGSVLPRINGDAQARLGKPLGCPPS